MDTTYNTTKLDCKKTRRFSLRNLRLSLKYRPEIYKLILKMRHCIRTKNLLLVKLKRQLKLEIEKTFSTSTQTESIDEKVETKEVSSQSIHQIDKSTQSSCFNTTENRALVKKLHANVSDTYTQTDHIEPPTIESVNVEKTVQENNEVSTAWTMNDNGDTEKSIAEQVKEVAQSALQETGMVYVDSAGMYYDYKTGYYYNSELGLYYHTDTSCYYYYSDEKKSFVFHSYPIKSAAHESLKAHELKKAKKHKKGTKSDDIENLTKQFNQDNEEGSKPKRRKIVKKVKKTLHSEQAGTDKSKETVVKVENSGEMEEEVLKIEDKDNKQKDSNEELEDGECSDTASEATEAESDVSTSTATDDDSVAKHHPPCMRLIVRETNLPKLKVGTLYLITKDGGTIGREGEYHSIVIRDQNVSRNHLEIKYDIQRKVYTATDLGSKNGTILNGTRMSESQEVSSKMEIVHGSTLQLGETKLLCHIHPGNDTCGHCEPGLIMESQEKEKKVAYTRTCSVQKQHQLELARLKNKYAPQPLAIEETAYNDRAQVRRETIGSSHHSEKTQSSDINMFIAPENKGFKLLEKMGWSKGEGLGKDSQGDTEPIPLVSNEGKSGLGAAGAPAATARAPTVSKTLGPATLRLAAKTKMLQPPAKAFQQIMDEDSE